MVQREARAKVTQVDIARRVGIDVSSVNKILNRREGPVFRKETVQKVFRIAHELGFDFGNLKFHHRRRHSRREISVGAEISIYNRDGSLYDQGMATIRDISTCGARVTDVTLPLGSLPVEPFSVGLRPMQKPLDDYEIHGHIVRIHPTETVSYGIDFLEADQALQGPVSVR